MYKNMLRVLTLATLYCHCVSAGTNRPPDLMEIHIITKGDKVVYLMNGIRPVPLEDLRKKISAVKGPNVLMWIKIDPVCDETAVLNILDACKAKTFQYIQMTLLKSKEMRENPTNTWDEAQFASIAKKYPKLNVLRKPRMMNVPSGPPKSP